MEKIPQKDSIPQIQLNVLIRQEDVEIIDPAQIMAIGIEEGYKSFAIIGNTDRTLFPI